MPTPIKPYVPLTITPEESEKLATTRPDFRPKLGEVGKGIRAFADEMQALGGGAVALGSEALRKVAPDVAQSSLADLSQWGLEVNARNMEEATAGRQAPKIAKVEDIESIGDAVDWAAFHGTKGLATVASLLGTGGVGGAVGKAVVKGGVKQFAKAKLGETIGKTTVTEGVKKGAQQEVAKSVRRGATVGALGGAFGMEAGGAFGEQVAEGVAPAEAIGPSAMVGMVNAALELTPFGLAARYLGVGGKAVNGIREVLKSDSALRKKVGVLSKKVGVGIVGGAAAEGVTEGVQELVNIAGERWAKNEGIFEQLSPEQQSQILNATASGALVGGVVGGPLGPFKGAAAPGEIEGAAAEQAAAEATTKTIAETPVGVAPQPVVGAQEEIEPVVEEQVAPVVTEEVPSAIQNQEAARVDGIVQQPEKPEDRTSKVPANERGEGISSRGQQEETETPTPEVEVPQVAPVFEKGEQVQFPDDKATQIADLHPNTPYEVVGVQENGDVSLRQVGSESEVVVTTPRLERLQKQQPPETLEAQSTADLFEPIEPEELRVRIRKEPGIGGGWLRKAEASGFLKIHNEPSKSGASGRWNPTTGVMHLYAPNMPKGEDPIGVVLHEGHHAGMSVMLGESIVEYEKDLIGLGKEGNVLAKNAMTRASKAAKKKFPKGRTLENTEQYNFVVRDEALAYFIQNARAQDKKLPLYRRVIEAIKAWWAQTDLGKAAKKAGLAPSLTEDMAIALARRATRLSLELQEVGERKQVGVPQLVSVEKAASEAEDLFSIPEEINKVFEPAGEYIFGAESNTSERSRFSKFQGWLQDQLNELKAKQEGIAKATDKPIPESQMAHEAETASHGRKSDRTFEFQKTYVDPMLRLMNRAGFSVEDINETTYANHATEANERGRRTQALNFFDQIKKDVDDDTRKEMVKAKSKLWSRTGQDNKERQLGTLDLVNRFVAKALQETQEHWAAFYEKPSGMSDEEAQSIKIKWKDNANMAELLSLFDEMNARVPKWYVEAGMLSQDKAAKWTGAYEHYATLRREGFEDEAPGLGRGYSAGRPSAIRQFSTRRAVDTFANSIWKAEQAIQKTENNQVVATLAKLIEANPEPDFWTVHKHDKAPFLDENGFVRFGATKALDSTKDTVFWKQGNPYIISAALGNQKATSIIRAMNNLDAPKLGPILRVMRKANRFMAHLNTSLSPEFFVTNLPRDFFTAQFNIADSEAGALRKEIIKNYLPSAKALRKVLRAKSLEKPVDRSDEWVDWARKFEEVGGRTGWMDVYEDTEQRVAKLQKRTRQLKPGIHKQVHNAAQWIEDYNAVAENAVRLATFRSLVDSGVNVRRAVSIVKDVTVNFNRRGSAASSINALYMFAGAGIQGSARILSALKSAKVRKLVYGTIATSFVVDQLNRALDDDDDYDKVPDYVKERNLVFLNPVGKGVITIPAPWGYNLVWAIGQKASEGISHVRGDLPDWTLGGATADLASTAFNAFMPVGGGTLLQALSPTVLDPIVQIGENKDAFGRALKPEPFPGEVKPLSEQYWSSVSGFSKKAAQIVNSVTGGDDVTEGWGSFSPAWLDAISGQIFGSVGRQFRDVGYELPAAVFGDEELKLRKTPLARKFVAYPSSGQETAIYHDRVARVLSAEKRLQLYTEGPQQDFQKARDLRQDAASELRQVKRVKETEKVIRTLRKRQRIAESRDDKVSAERWKDQIEREREKFNQAWKRMVE